MRNEKQTLIDDIKENSEALIADYQNKISEIQINGDGQRIKIPSALIRRNQINEVTIKTGRNLMQTAYIDYDDIEFMNLFIEN